MRIDVHHQPAEIEAELATLYRRMHSPGSALYGLPALKMNIPELDFRYREADGETYIYVEDKAARRLAGYTVFNRLIELNRRADPHLRAPHSKYAAPYQRRGIATAIYRWALANGLCLISGARQSAGANALWHKLARDHELILVDLRNKTLRYLGHGINKPINDDLHTRMVLICKEQDVERLAVLTGMLMEEPAPVSGSP